MGVFFRPFIINIFCSLLHIFQKVCVVFVCVCFSFGRSKFGQKCFCVHVYTPCRQTRDELMIIYYYVLGLVSSCMKRVLSFCLPPLIIPKTAIISFSYLSPISQYQRLAWPVCLGPDPPRPASHPRTAHATATWTALWTGPTLESWTTRPGHKRWRCPAKAWGSESAVASPLTSCYSCQILTCF